MSIPEHRCILAMGGGGFSMEPGNPALDDYVLRLSSRPEPRICLLPTAGGDSDEQILRFHVAFADRSCVATHLSLFRLGRRPVSVRDTLLAQDIIYVGGGSMRNLLAVWREHDLHTILAEAWVRGVVLCGISAGSMCWFQGGITRSGGEPGVAPGLGFLPGSNSVHYDGEPQRRPAFLAAVGDGSLPPGWGVDDGVGLLFRGRTLTEVVSSRPAARAYWVRRTPGGGVQESELPPRFLGAPEASERPVPFAIREMRLARAGRRGGLR